MAPVSRYAVCLAVFAAAAFPAMAQQPVASEPPKAPPPPPPIEARLVPRSSDTVFSRGAEVLYSIGSPSDDEQYYVELINRARMNPAAEGLLLATATDADVLSAISYFSVDLTMLQSEFNAIAAAPPVSISSALTTAARGHSDWMFANAVQGHTGDGGSTPGTRITAAGYSWSTYGENVFSYAKSVFHGHAGFEIDWGTGTGGMQTGRGHRVNTHSSNFREIGVGVHNGSNTVGANTIGPQLVTQDFATASGGSPFVTGVAYYDFNANNFYDPGEGIGGLMVTVEGSGYYAVTANSGGYSVPVPNTNTTRAITFSGPGLAQSGSATITNLHNVKVDFKPQYFPPVVSGPVVVSSGLPTNYTISAVAGASQYGWQYATKLSAVAENCENLNKVTTNTSPGYSVLDTTVKNSGTASFHLAHPAFVDQTITLAKTYYPQAGSTLQFRSRLGLATNVQTARVQVTPAGSEDWVDLYTQNGTGNQGELSFVTRSVSLSDYAGQFVNLRFAFTVTNSAYPQASSGIGWYIDTITFANTSELGGIVETGPLASPAFAFTPPATGDYLLSARPYLSGRYWSYGPVMEVSAQAPVDYAGWVVTQYPAVTEGTSGDHDADGLSNLVEFAFGFDPTSFTNSASLPQPVIQGDQWQVSYTSSPLITGIVYGAEWSTDLVHWTPLTNSASGNTHSFTFDVQGKPKIFFRHRVILMP